MGTVQIPLWARLGIGIGLAGALAYMTTPIAILTARRFAFYDRPAGYKRHAAPTPYLGGAALVTAFALALLLDAGDTARTLPLLAGAAVLFVVGTIDDRRTVSPLLRVLVEFLLGAMLAAAGLGWHLGAGHAVDALINGIWVIAVVNAFNLFDNMDGAASTMAFVVAGGACILGLVTGDRWVTVSSAALCGACLGFLPHNLARPARIFLGDGGSMPLGFAVAVLVASAARSAEPSTLSLLIGFLLVGVPALDTCLVVVSRRRRGISILTGGQDHLTHRTRRRFLTARNVALVLGSAQAVVSALVIAATRESSVTLVYISLAFVVCAVAAIVGLDEIAPASAPADGAESITATADDRIARPAPQERGEARRARRPWESHLGTLGVAVLGVGAGISPFFSAYYDSEVWVSLGLGITIAAAIGAIARAPRVRLPIVLTLGGVAGLAVWSLLSTTWAGAAENASVEANRWFTYAALLLLLIVLLRSRRNAQVLLIAVGVGVTAVAVAILVGMLGHHPLNDFAVGRLNSPLGYIDGEGCVFAMTCWGGVALAERREPVLAGLGAALTVVMASLVLLTESRGAAIAILASVVVVLAAVPGFRRRMLALAVIAGGFAAIAGPVAAVYSHQSSPLEVSVVHHAAALTLIAAAVTGLVWGALVALARAAARNQRWGLLGSRAATALAVALLAAPFVAIAVKHSTVQHKVSSQWNSFVHLSTQRASAAATQSRLFSGSGARYDYWRIALDVFVAHPIVGVGAGNYEASYYRLRRTDEAIKNPHSFPLETLSELGIVGAVLLALAVAGIVVGARRLRATARRSLAARTTMVAATGMVVVWFVDSSGDWMQLLPGVAAMALAAAAVLCTEGGRTGPAARARSVGTHRLGALAGVAVVAFVLAVGGANLARARLTQLYLDQARSELVGHPSAAIRDAGRALTLDAADLDAYYVKAAGEAFLHQAAPTLSTLLAAKREDPESFQTWTLLGDLEARLHNFSVAGSFYQRAHKLNPLDPTLATLAANPAAGI